MTDESRSGNEQAAHPRRILDALRSDDDDAKRSALQRLYDTLTHHARQRLGAKRDRVNVMPESVVQSVIVREVAAGALDRVKDDQHLEARLKQAINHKVIDRGRKRLPGEMPVDKDGMAFDPGGFGPGPATQLVQHEEVLAQTDKLRAFYEACMAAAISDTQKRFVELAIFEKHSLDEVAQMCNTSASTVKVRLSEARKKIVRHLLEPLRAEVDGMTWAIIDVILIQRKGTERARTMLGAEQSDIKRAISKVVVGSMVERYGAEGMAVFERLLGNRKR